MTPITQLILGWAILIAIIVLMFIMLWDGGDGRLPRMKNPPHPPKYKL